LFFDRAYPSSGIGGLNHTTRSIHIDKPRLRHMMKKNILAERCKSPFCESSAFIKTKIYPASEDCHAIKPIWQPI
jgi:hypothetical protein